MRENFIIKFVGAVIEFCKDLNEAWNWEPLYYKGIRVKGRDYNDFRKVYKGIKNLEQRGIVDLISGKNYRFTEKGKKWLNSQSLKYFRLRYPKWDKKWRLVIFDIPQELHRKRNHFRAKLRNLGFYMMQKSVFILPYPCEEELSDICQRLNINDYVDVIKANSAGFTEKEIRKHFGL